MKAILLLEDDPVVGQFLREELTRAGYEPTIVRELEDVPSLLPVADLICADITLGHGHGDDTVAYLATISHHLPVIVCSGHANTAEGERYKRDCLSAGVLEYVDKLKAITNSQLLVDAIRSAELRFIAWT